MKKIISSLILSLALAVPCASKMTSNSKAKPVKICVVRVSEADEKKYGELPWPRSFHANLVQKLEEAGASWVVLKFLFEEPTNESTDNKLIAVCRRFSNVILPSAYAEVPPSVPFHPEPFTLHGQADKTRFLTFPSAIGPFKDLAESAIGIGNMNLKTEGGKFIGYPQAVRVGGILVPSLALMTAARARGFTAQNILVSDGELRMGNQVLAMDGEGMIRDLKLSPPEKFPSYDYSQIVNNEFRQRDVFEAIVLVGYAGKKMDADFSTEISEHHPSIYIDADAIRHLLTSLKDIY